MTRKITQKLSACAVAALALAVCVTLDSRQAQAGSHWGVGVGAGLVTGALIGAAITSNADTAPVYVRGPLARDCRYVRHIDAWGNPRVIRVCDVY